MEKNTFITESDEIPEPHSMKKVRDLHGQLTDTVSNLSTKITVLLREREKDFLAAYRHHMYNVQKDLQEAKRSVKKAKDDLRNNDQIKKLKKERDWFRNEALRLEKGAKTQEKEIDSLEVKFSTLREDRVWFEKQLKIAKRQNKILTAELGMQLHRGSESSNQRPQTHDGTDADGASYAATGPASIFSQSVAPMEDQMREMQYTLSDLKEKLRESKRRNKNLQAVVNHHTKSGEYEELFMTCVDEIKKEASRRREKVLISQRKSRRDANIIEKHGIHMLAKQELSEITASDKRKIIEVMLNHDEIFSHLYSLIFDSDSHSAQRSALPRIE